MRVYLMAVPLINWGSWLQFAEDEKLPDSQRDLWYNCTRSSETLCELSGRICYMSYGKGRKTTKEFLDNIIESGHHSVLEHANYTLFITGISRSCSHELVRHRHLSFSQLSQRYVDETTALTIMPEIIGKIGAEDVFRRATDTAKTAYRVLVSNLELALKDIEDKTLRRKAARQAARAVLPNATETKIAVTGNARAWRHFIQLRMSPHADVEIRNLATRVWQVLNEHSPLLFSDLGPACAST